MTLSENQRNRRATKRKQWWNRMYRERMRKGLEGCRNRGCSRLASTFGHLTPHAVGGRFVLDNVTLLCQPCNARQGMATWPWLQPLSSEPEHEGKIKQWREDDREAG